MQKYYLRKRAERLITICINVYMHINLYLKQFYSPIACKTAAQTQQVDVSHVIRTRTIALISVPNTRNTSGSCCSPAEQKYIEYMLYIWNRVNLWDGLADDDLPSQQVLCVQ